MSVLSPISPTKWGMTAPGFVFWTSAERCLSATQAVQQNRYGLEVISDFAIYERLVRLHPNKQLVEVQSVEPTIRVDVRYATTDNFLHTVLYPVAKVFVRRPVALALRDVQRDLATLNLGLKVFDGYRPYRVTERMWEPIRNPDF